MSCSARKKGDMSEWLPDGHENVYRTADGALTWLETQRLYEVREYLEMREQERMDAEVRLVRKEAYWKFLRYLFGHGAFADDQLPRAEGKYDESAKGW